jgi:plastocyanin
MNKVIIAAIVAIIAVGGLLAVVMMNKDDTKTNNTSSSTTTDTEGTDSNGTANEGSEDTSALGGPVETNAVNIKDNDFEHAEIKVKKGTEVTWTNNGSLPHTVTGKDGVGPHSQSLKNGDTYTYTFNAVGTFEYYCEFHTGMTAKVTVVE